jgi:MFS family permease
MDIRFFKKYFKYNNFPEFDPKVLQHNLLMHLGDGSMYVFAMSFVYFSTILPVFIQRMGGSEIAIGAVPVLWNLGVNFPQIFLGQQKSDEQFVKPAVIRYSIFYRASFLAAAIFIFFFLKDIPVSISVPIILLFILIIAVLGSIPGPRWVNLFAKTTPVKLRGRLLAVRQLTGALLGVLAGSIIIVILSSIKFPQNFALLFFLCFIFMFVSLYFLNGVKESEEIQSTELIVAKIRKFERIKTVIKENKNFRNYLIADGLLLMGLTSSAFFAVYAIERFKLPTSYAGSFTIIFMSSTVFGNIIFGYLADVFGHKINLMIMAAVLLLACLSAIISINPLTYGSVFFFYALAQSIQGISRIAFVVEISGEKERTLYASLLNSITAPALLFGILAGFTISIIGFPLVFLIYITIMGFTVYWLFKKIDEPRQVKII